MKSGYGDYLTIVEANVNFTVIVFRSYHISKKRIAPLVGVVLVLGIVVADTFVSQL